MKRIIFALMLVLLGAFTVLSVSADGHMPELPDLGGRTITVAVENAYIPFNFLDDDGNPVGWDYDAVGAICERLNCVPEFVETSWDGMILAVSNGEFDMAADGITITEERAEVVDFSIGYIRTDQVLLTRIDEERFTNIDEFAALTDLRVGSQPGTTNYELAAQLVGEARIVAYETFPVAVQALIAGDVDAVFMDDTAGQGYVGVNADALKITGDSMKSDELGFIFPPGSELRDAFNAALMHMMADRSLEIINARWFPPQLPDLGGRVLRIPTENSYPPFAYQDQESGEFIGWNYDTLAEICARLNCTPEFITTAWDGMILAVSNNEFDLAADGISITEERKEVVDFSLGYLRNEQVLLVRADEDRFTNVDELIALEDFRVGSQPGTTNYELAVELVGEERIIAYETFSVAVQALIAGDVDTVFMDNVAGQGYVGVNADAVKITGDALLTDELGFIFPKGSELTRAFDIALISMINDGTLAEINAKWFSTE